MRAPAHKFHIDTGSPCDLSLFLMALLHESVNFKKFDIRMVERNIARGVLSPQEYTDLVKNLPDDGENAEWVNVASLEDDGSGDSSEHSVMNGKGPH